MPVERVDVSFELDMHYLGQTHAIATPLPLAFDGGATGVTAEMVQSAFEASYKGRFSRILDGAPIKIVSLRATLRMLRKLTHEPAPRVDDMRAVLAAGVSREQIKEVLMQSAFYCGGPAALEAFRNAAEVFAAMDAEAQAATGASQ